MLNVLVYEKNIYNCKNIVNSISTMNLDIRIYSIVTEIFEIEKFIVRSKIDLIILDILDDDNSYMNFITKSIILARFNNPIIVLTKNSKSSQNIITKNLVIIENFDLLCNTLNLLLSSSSITKLKSIIAKELDYLCFNPNHIGTKYLIDVISFIYQESSLIKNLNKFVYPKISTKYSISINTLKCDIFQSTLYSYINCEESKLENYLKKSCIEKPSTKSYINSIIEHIQLGTLKK